MFFSVAECQKQWKKLRDCYKKALRLRQYKSGSARKNEKPIKFEKELEFLKPYLQDKPQTSNLGCSEDSLDINTEDNTMIESPAPPSDVMQSPRIHRCQIIAPEKNHCPYRSYYSHNISKPKKRKKIH